MKIRIDKADQAFRKKRGKFIACSACKKLHYRSMSRINSIRHSGLNYFCSRECRKNFDCGGRVDLKCRICGKDYKTYKSHIKHRGSSCCSNNCRMKKQGLFKKSKDRSAYKKRLWMVFSQYIRQRDKGICISCGKVDEWKNTDAGHYIPKTAGLALYFDEKNVNAQCTSCNRFRHGNLSQYALALRRKHGEQILEELEWKRRLITKITELDYVELIKLYKKKISEL